MYNIYYKPAFYVTHNIFFQTLSQNYKYNSYQQLNLGTAPGAGSKPIRWKEVCGFAMCLYGIIDLRIKVRQQSREKTLNINIKNQNEIDPTRFCSTWNWWIDSCYVKPKRQPYLTPELPNFTIKSNTEIDFFALLLHVATSLLLDTKTKHCKITLSSHSEYAQNTYWI